MPPGQPEMHPLRSGAPDLPPAPSLENIARDRLLAVIAGLGFLHLMVALAHLLHPDAWSLRAPFTFFRDMPWTRVSAWVLAVASASFFLIVRLLLPRLPLRWAHPLGAFSAVVVVLNSLASFSMGATPEKTIAVILAVLGAGLLLFSTRVLAIVMAIALGGWFGIARQAAFDQAWFYCGAALLASCVMAVLFQRLQIQSIKQMLRTHPGLEPARNVEMPRGAGADADEDERFRRWYEATFEGIAIHERGVVLEANQALATLLDREISELKGKNLLDWFTRASRDMIEESILLGNFRPFEAVAQRRDRTEVHLELFSKRIPFRGREVMVTAFRDITERQRAATAASAEQTRLQQQYRRQAALASLSATSGNPMETASTLERIALAAAEVLPCTAGACILVPDAGRMAPAAATLSESARAKGFDPAAQLTRVTDWILENSETFVASNVTRDDPFQVNEPVQLLSAYVGVPLLDGDKVVGVLYALHADEPRHHAPDEMDFLDALATRAAAAITRARLYGEISDANERLQKQSEMLQLQNEQLTSAKRHAEAASEAKSEFLTKISHELRTPLNGVIGMTDYLLTSDLSADQRESAETIRDCADKLLQQINELLDFSRLESGAYEPNVAEFTPRDLLATIARRAVRALQGKPVQFRHETETSVPARLIGDAAALEQALWKIVENGIRFTDDGEVSVKLSVENASGPNVCLRVSVRDTGIGISHELKSKLFRSFTQADGSNARAHEGLGLGLAIVKHLVTALRGDLGFESEPGTGTTFWIVLPLQKSLDPALPTGLSA